MPVTSKRYSASNCRYFSASRQPLSGITPMPRQPRSVTVKTSSSSARAAGLPCSGTARPYALSTKCSPRSSWCTVRRMPSRMSSGSNPVTTIGTENRSASPGYSLVPITLHTCPAARNPCTRQVGEVMIASMAGGTRTWETSIEKLVTPSRWAW